MPALGKNCEILAKKITKKKKKKKARPGLMW
jgi:hypothetical protein